MPTPTQDRVLQAIDLVIRQCTQSQDQSMDTIVEEERLALNRLRSNVTENWPLSQSLKSMISIGAMAAKNLSDWNPSLARNLMVLDHILKHDGDSLEKLIS